MKTLVLCFLFALTGNGTFAANQVYKPDFTSASHQIISNKGPKQSFHSLKNEMEIKLGRQLSFKEKAALRIHTLIHPFSRELERKANNQATTGFVLSLLGFVTLWPLLIPGLIISNSALTKERINPGILTSRNYKLAKAGRTLAVIGLFITVIGLIIIISNGGFYGY